MSGLNLSAWALRHQVLVGYLMAVLTLAGAISYVTLGRAEDPDFTIKTMVVTAEWPGATAREMEQQVTDRLEKKLQETPWLDFIQSYSKPGKSVLLINLKDYTPTQQVADVWYQVRKKISDIRGELPEEVKKIGFNDEFGDTYGTIYAFTADGLSHAELKQVVDDVRQELLRIPDVAKVDLIGVQKEKIFVEISQRKLASLGLDPSLIVNTLQQQNAMTPAGAIDTPSDLIFARVGSSELGGASRFSEIGIQANDRIFRLGDIAHITRDYADPPTPRFRYMGQPAIGLAISMRKGGDILKLGKALSAEIARLEAHLPLGVEIHQVANQPRVVQNSVGEFMKSLTEALVIVLGVSFLSLGMRTGLVVALCIPIVLAITFLCMKILGIDLQRISLGALIIALGLLVDDAIISVEMMVVKMEQGWDRFKAATFAYTSTAFPMLTGTLVTAAAFMPVGFARSSAGEYCFSMFAVVAIALLVSWGVAVVFTPWIGFHILPDLGKSDTHGGDVYQRGIYPRFRRLLTNCLMHRSWVIGITVGVFIVSLGLFGLVEQQFFPFSNRPEVLIDLWLPQGASTAATEAEVSKVEALLAGDADIDNQVVYIGSGSLRFYLPLDQQLENKNFAQFVVLTKDLPARERLIARLRPLLEREFTGLRPRLTRLENGPPVGFPVQFRVMGRDITQTRRIAEKVAEVMRQNPHVGDVHLDWGEPSKIVRVDVDQDKARLLGVSTQSISQLLSTLLSGFPITSYRENDNLIEVLGRAPLEERDNPALLGEAPIKTTSGKTAPLSQLARLSYGFEDGVIWRRDRYPIYTVRSDIRDNAQAPDVTAQIEPLLTSIRANLPDGYRIELGGAVESSQKAQASINAVMPVMLLTVITLLMLQLQSVQRTLMVLLTAPLGLIGVTVFLLIFHVPFGFVAMLGVIALAGMIMRNSVILVDQIEHDIAAGEQPWNAVIEATIRRLRPILLTAAAAILAMIPLAGSDFWGPMAIAIMGGLTVATVQTLLFLPSLYAAWFKIEPGS